MIWGCSGNGVFSIKSAYSLIENYHTFAPNPLFKLIWKWAGPERIRVLLWKVVLDKLPTNVWRSTWSQASTECGFCISGVEDIMPLRDCPYAKNLWLDVLNPRFVSNFFLM